MDSLLRDQINLGIDELVSKAEKEAAMRTALDIIALVHDYIPEELRQKLGRDYSY